MLLLLLLLGEEGLIEGQLLELGGAALAHTGLSFCMYIGALLPLPLFFRFVVLVT